MKRNSSIHSVWVHAEASGIVPFDFATFTFEGDANSTKTAAQEYYLLSYWLLHPQ